VLCLALIAATIDIIHVMVAWILGMVSQDFFWLSVARIVVWWGSYIPFMACAFVLADRYRLDGTKRNGNLAIHLLAAVAFAYIHAMAYALMEPRWLMGAEAYFPRLFSRGRSNFPIDFILYWAIVGATYAFHYYSELHHRSLAAEQLKTTAAQLEVSLTEARLSALRSQLNPHFLFNTLNAISGLALKGESKAVARVLSKLSDLLRISLDEDRPQLIPLTRELEFTESYVAIQRLWYGDRVTIDWVIQPEARNALVPAMILQPIVENAFVHGVAKSHGSARVQIEAYKEGDKICMIVSDNGRGFSSTAVPRSGIGLSNTEARLSCLYGSNYELRCGEAPEQGGRVTIRFMFATTPEKMLA
jgi:two-component system LytT family sensor kinase